MNLQLKSAALKLESRYHDAERQNDVAVSGVVQHLNEWLERKVDRIEGQAEVPRPKQSKPTGF